MQFFWNVYKYLFAWCTRGLLGVDLDSNGERDYLEGGKANLFSAN